MVIGGIYCNLVTVCDPVGKFKNGDVSGHTYRSTLIGTSVNRNYLYDSDDLRVEIYCNASDQILTVL